MDFTRLESNGEFGVLKGTLTNYPSPKVRCSIPPFVTKHLIGRWTRAYPRQLRLQKRTGAFFLRTLVLGQALVDDRLLFPSPSSTLREARSSPLEPWRVLMVCKISRESRRECLGLSKFSSIIYNGSGLRTSLGDLGD